MRPKRKKDRIKRKRGTEKGLDQDNTEETNKKRSKNSINMIRRK